MVVAGQRQRDDALLRLREGRDIRGGDPAGWLAIHENGGAGGRRPHQQRGIAGVGWGIACIHSAAASCQQAGKEERCHGKAWVAQRGTPSCDR